MPDDFQDLRERMQEHHEAVEVFLFTVGATLIQCQAFEDRLRQYKVYVHDIQPNTTEAEAEALISASRRKDTLGSLLRDLGQRVTIAPNTQTLLDEFLSERNWFIHHLEYQHNGVAFDRAALAPVMQRMSDIQKRAIHLQRAFAELTMAWAETRGVSREEIDAAARILLSTLIRPPGTTS